MGHRDRTTVADPVHSRRRRNLMYKELQVDPGAFSTSALLETETIAQHTVDSDVCMSHMNQASQARIQARERY